MFGPIDLGRFDAPLQSVKLPNGREFKVRPIDGVGQRAIIALNTLQLKLNEMTAELAAAAKEGRPADQTKLLSYEQVAKFTGTEPWDLTARYLVGEPDDVKQEVERLSMAECTIILKVAQGQLKNLLDELEEHEKKGEARSEPGHNQATRSATPATA